jgi:hypothetical protein
MISCGYIFSESANRSLLIRKFPNYNPKCKDQIRKV